MPLLSFKRSPHSGRAMLVLLTLGLVSGCDSPSSAPAGTTSPIPVVVEAAARESLTVTADYVGRVKPSREVEVRAQVGGILESRLFHEGDKVQQGRALFIIDRAPYRIALQRAEAELADAGARLNQARRDWQRIEKLYATGVVSARDADQAKSQLELAQASVSLAEAGVAQAQLNLDYATVKAPIGGKTSLESLPEGSLIERGTRLTVITQRNPVHVLFSMPQSAAAEQLIINSGDGDSRAAELVLADGSVYVRPGTVDFTDGSIDPHTGNISARAIFPNPDDAIIPGQVARVRLPVDSLPDALVVDPRALLMDEQGSFVFVVGDDMRLSRRQVEAGPLVEHRQVILAGLKAGDQVVVSGQIGLRDGLSVALPGAVAEGG